ncbi:MAG: hypothetical protein D6714_01490 [Bacteroidetes bacterium]|nr:MAG: hypothetical protein D6714_01490 [Bacteroidota bacterium]
MKNIVTFFCCLFLLTSCNQKGGSGTPAQGAAIDLTGFEIYDVPGSDFKKVVKRSASGQLLEEGMILNGKRNGMWVTYFENKELPKTIVNYVNDTYSGAWFSFNDRGQLEEMRGYLNNELDGKWAKTKFGRFTEEGHYKNGKLDGTYRSYFPNSDKVQKELNYKDGELHGTFKYFNDKGEVTLDYIYEHGKKIKGGIVENQQ